tara:strand:- start:49 stop:426 length:378 start_codon:yes stop_codon:yes gene_type:complete
MDDNKKPFDRLLDGADDWTTREVFDNLNDKDQRLLMFNIMEDYENRLFDLQAKLEVMESETSILETASVEILQRKDVWSKAQVVSYFDISAKTFERWKASGEIKVKTIGGKDYCLLTDLKDRLKN